MSTHQRIFRCFEHEEIFGTLAAYEEHVRDYPKQDAVSSKFATSTMNNVNRSCPVCSVALGSMQKLQSHIALHLERFAMFSLPRHTNSSEESETGSNAFTAHSETEVSFNSNLDLESNIADKHRRALADIDADFGDRLRDSHNICSTCSKTFSNAQNFNDHLNECLGPSLQEEGIARTNLEEPRIDRLRPGELERRAEEERLEHEAQLQRLAARMKDRNTVGGSRRSRIVYEDDVYRFGDSPEQVQDGTHPQPESLVPLVHSNLELTESTPPVSEALLPIYGQLQTVKRCLLEVRNSGGVSSVRELYPYTMKLNSINNLRVDGKFVVNGDIPEGQYRVSELLAECFDLSHDLRVEVEDAAADTPRHSLSSSVIANLNALLKDEVYRLYEDDSDDDESENRDGLSTAKETLNLVGPFGGGPESATLAFAEKSQTVLEDSTETMQSRPPMVRKKNGELVQPALRGHIRPSSMPGTPQDAEAASSDSRPEHSHFPSDLQSFPAGAGSSLVEDFEGDAGSKSGHMDSSIERTEDGTHQDKTTEAQRIRKIQALIEQELHLFNQIFRSLKNDVDMEIEFENKDAHGRPEARDLARKMEIYRLEVEELKDQFDKETLKAKISERAQELSTKMRSWDFISVKTVIEDIQANREKWEAKKDLGKLEAEHKADVDELDRKAAALNEAKRKAKEDAEKGGAEPAPIKFKDAVGRKFSFPFHLCSTWQAMEDLIKQAFLHVDVLGPHVQEGHYDLVGPNGEIILPVVWDKVIEPGWAITMTMWPLDEAPPVKNSQHSPPPYPGFAPFGPTQGSRSSKPKNEKGNKRKSVKNDPRSPISGLDNGSDGDAEGSDVENSDAAQSEAERGNAASGEVINAASKKLGEIGDELRLIWLPLCLDYIDAPPNDPKKRKDEHRKLSENILQQVFMKLDEVETEGIHEIRQRRKELVREAQAVLKRLDAAKASSEAEGEDTVGLSKKEEKEEEKEEEEEEEAAESERAARVQLQGLAQANANYWPRMSGLSMDKAEEKRKDAEIEETEAAREYGTRNKSTLATCSYPGCSNSYNTKKELQRHIFLMHAAGMHATKDRFHCSITGCDYSEAGGKIFFRRDNWKRHMREIHNIDQQSLPEPVEVKLVVDGA